MLPDGFVCRLSALSITLASIVCAERLPMHTYSTESGLAHNHVSRIRRDSRGFYWFCTDDGLSRWDGYQFRTYRTSDGLPHQHIDDLLETRGGEYWIATDQGIARFDPEKRLSPFTSYFPGDSTRSRSVNVLAEDKDGSLLLGTGDGLYRLQRTPSDVHFRREEIGIPDGQYDAALVTALLVSRDGALWAGTGSGIYRRGLDGRWERLCTRSGLPQDFVNQLREDPEGRIWAGTRGGGLVELAAGASPAHSAVAHIFTKADGLPGNDVRDMLFSRDGRLWVGTATGLAEALPGTAARLHFQRYSIADGLAEQSVYCLTEDSAGNLWLGTSQIGAIRVARAGFHTYTEADGFRPQEVNEIMETPDGQLCIVSGDHSRRLLQCFDGRRFWAKPLGIAHVLFGYEWSQFALEDQSGAWWFAAEPGALRVSHATRPADLTRIKSAAVLAASGSARHVFRDSRGDIWIGGWTSASSSIVRWSALSHTASVLWEAPYTAARRPTSPSYFTEDATGQIWAGLSGEGGVLRSRHDRFELLTVNDGVPRGDITALYADRAGGLWIASTEGGLARALDPGSSHPRIRSYTRENGLSVNEIWCITEDQAGRIYAGTSTGVEVVDPTTDRVMRYTADDGLVPGYVRACFRDRAGDLWFATNRGVSRFTPMVELPYAAPRALITGFRVNGIDSGISQLGAPEVGSIDLAPSQNQVAIDFAGIDNRLRGDLRYQYRLAGSAAGWTRPAPERSVTFAGMAPGQYLFEVRALDVFGEVSPAAVVRFSIRPPFWNRWWFRVLLFSIALAAVYSLQHYRMLRLLELERVRMRIATDLHDDIGSALSQIAILAEVVRMRMDGAADLRPMLSNIAFVSRELVESMSDIVWSINPQRDRASDLLQRMRRFASDVLSNRNIEIRFEVSASEQPVAIATEIRREVYLIFKEAINNLARHSGCSRAEIFVSIGHRALELRIEDNGKGLSEAGAGEGNGLRNMKERAGRIGGRIEFGRGEQGGATIVLRVPLRLAAPLRSRTT